MHFPVTPVSPTAHTKENSDFTENDVSAEQIE